MRLYLLALNPTEAVTEGYLPAAHRLGLDVTVLTEPRYREAHQAAYRPAEPAVGRPKVCEAAVRDPAEAIGWIAADAARHGGAFGVFSNSDHLQPQTALAAGYFGLPGKDWTAALRTKNKAETRRRLAEAGADPVWAAELPPGADPERFARERPVRYPCVVKPREGVASEDVVLAGGPEELAKRAAAIQAARPGRALVVEEFLPGELHTLETLGDGAGPPRVLGGFHTALSAPPYFVEERMTFEPAAGQGGGSAARQVLGQLAALGVGFGACHTEFVVGADGRARIVEVNYRSVGDGCDLLLQAVLGVPLFEQVLRVHLGEALPADLGARGHRRARVEWPLADRPGVLAAAPPAADLSVDGVRLAYRPLRAVGERHELYRTNRDYLGVLRAVGGDQRTVDRVAAGYLAGLRWEITP